MEGLRLLIRMNKIPMWKIADVCGVSEMTIYRWLRKYNAEHYEKILNAINQIKERKTEHEQDNENV